MQPKQKRHRIATEKDDGCRCGNCSRFQESVKSKNGLIQYGFCRRGGVLAEPDEVCSDWICKHYEKR